MSDDFDIRRLHVRDRKDGFCAGPGYEPLDVYLQRYAWQNEKRQQTVTHVAAVGDRVVGYATTVPGTVEPSRLRPMVKGLSSYPAPVLVLARLATDVTFTGRGVGPRLMREAVFMRALSLAADYGCVGIYVDAKPPPSGAPRGSANFYARYGFVALASPPEGPEALTAAPTPMFLALAAIPPPAPPRSPPPTP